MGFVKDAVKGFTGSGADAAKKAAGRQIEGQQKGIKTLREAGEFGVEKFQPFTQVGSTDIQGLGALGTQEGILGGAAAKGKAFAGGTAEALQNSLLLLGTDLVNQSITQRSNLANLGFRGATGEVNAKFKGAGGIADLQAGIGETGAAGVLGARQAESDAFEQVLALGTKAATGGFSPPPKE